MSYRLVDWAWSVRDLTPPTKLLLIALAQCCNGKKGAAVCWPSQARLREMTGLSERTIRYGLRALEARHLIACETGSGKISTRYRLAGRDSPNACLDLPEPEQAPRGGAGDAAPAGQGRPPSPRAGQQDMPPTGAGGAGSGATDAAGTGKKQGTGQGRPPRGTERASAAGSAKRSVRDPLSQPPEGDWREIAAAVRPDIADPTPVRAKFEAYHHSSPFIDPAEELDAWRLWLLRERTNNSQCYTKNRHQVREPGSFLATTPSPWLGDLTADYEVLRDEN